MNRPFTGWHMTAILVGFFGIVIAVNVIMARDAVSTFGGALAENGYVASQDYNHWIAAADAQDKLGWKAHASVVDGKLRVETSGPSNPQLLVTLVHPLGLVAETALTMRDGGGGSFTSVQSVPAGRWQAHIAVKAPGGEAKFIEEVRG